MYEQIIETELRCAHCGKRHLTDCDWNTRQDKTHRCVDDAAGRGCGAVWRVTVVCGHEDRERHHRKPMPFGPVTHADPGSYSSVGAPPPDSREPHCDPR